MDNVCHSLAGAVLAECGFARRTRFATAAMVIGANIPDIDVLYLFGGDLMGLESRRGWTHSIPALAAWPFVILWALMLWRRRVRRDATSDPPLDLRLLLYGTAIAVVSHPLLDWLNTYGVRFLMPLSEEWVYGDTLFIVDLVLLALFGSGWWIARRNRRRDIPAAHRPARTAVALALVYIAIMKFQSARSRAAVEDMLGTGVTGPRELMIAPLPVSMRTRSALIRTDSGYVVRLVRAGVTGVAVGPVSEFLPTRRNEPLSLAARATDDFRRFARWSRFPYFIPAPAGDSSVVFVGDARYARGSGDTWAGVPIRLGGQR